MADSFEHCEALVREGDKNRFLATLFAPQKFRRPLYLHQYAFNLEVARAREMAHEPMPGEIRLQWWRDVLGGAGRGEVAANPVAAALRDVVVRYRLPPRTLSELIDARSFDLYDEPVQSLSYLEQYAQRTSSALIDLAGSHPVRTVFSVDPAIEQIWPEVHAGIAYAISGLLLALPVHSLRRQLYLPVDLMQRYGAEAADVYAANATPELRAVLAELRLRARDHLGAARGLLANAPPEVAPALLPVALARPALDRMERRGYQPFQPDELPQWRRQWIFWRAARKGLKRYF